MPTTAEVSRVRAAIGGGEICDSTTVATIENLLRNLPAGKENSVSDSKGKRTASQITKSTRVLKQQKVTSVQNEIIPSPTLSSSKEKQVFATDVINQAIHTLTVAVRDLRNEAIQIERADKKLRWCGLVKCACVAFRYLLIPDMQGEVKNRSQLLQGMFAMVGKAIALSLHSEAMTILFDLRTNLAPLSNQFQSGTTPSIDQMILVPGVPRDLSSLKLLSNFHVLILKLAASGATDVEITASTAVLVSIEASTPLAVLKQRRDLKEETAELALSFETFLNCLSNLSKLNSRKSKGAASHMVYLEMYILEAKLTHWHVIGHEVDREKEVQTPILKAVRTFQTLPLADQSSSYDQFAAIVSRLLDSGSEKPSQCIETELCLELVNLAIANTRLRKASYWLTMGDIKDPLIKVQALLVKLRDTKQPDEPMMRTLLAELEGTQNMDYGNNSYGRNIMLQASRLCFEHLSSKKKTSESVKTLLCSILLYCARLCVPSSSMTGEISITQDIIELTHYAIMACNTLVDIGHRIEAQVLESEHVLRRIYNSSNRRTNGSTYVALSNLQWRIFSSAPLLDTLKVLDLGRASLSSLEHLAVEEQTEGLLLKKLSLIIKACVDEDLTEEAIKHVIQALQYFVSNDALSKAVNDLTRSRPEDLEALRIILSYQRRLSISSRRSLLQGFCSSTSIDSIYEMRLSYTWLLCAELSESDWPWGDVMHCISRLSQHKEEFLQISVDERCRVYQRILLLMSKYPDKICSSYVDRSLFCSENDSQLNEHESQMVQFIEAINKQQHAYEFYSKLVESWTTDDQLSGYVADSFDAAFFTEVLLWSSLYFRLRNWLTLEAQVLELGIRIATLANSVSPLTRFRSLVAQLQNHIRLSNVSDAGRTDLQLKQYEGANNFAGFVDQTRSCVAHMEFYVYIMDQDRVKEFSAIAMALATRKGLRRQEKMSLYCFQADMGRLMALNAFKSGDLAAASLAIREAIRLCKSIENSFSNRTSTCRPTSSEAQSATIIDGMSNLKLADQSHSRTKEALQDPYLLENTCRTLQCLFLAAEIDNFQGLGQSSRSWIQQASELSSSSGSMFYRHDLGISTLKHEIMSRKPCNKLADITETQSDEKIPCLLMSLMRGDWRTMFDESFENALADYDRAERYLPKGFVSESNDVTISNPTKIRSNNKARTLPVKAKQPAKQPAKQSRTKVSISKASKSLPINDKKEEAVKNLNVIINEPSKQLNEIVLCRKALALLHHGDLKLASELFSKLTLPEKGGRDVVQQYIAHLRWRLAQLGSRLELDVRYGTLQESVLCFPATNSGPIKEDLDTAVDCKTSHDDISLKGILNMLDHGLHIMTIPLFKYISTMPLVSIYEATSLSLKSMMLSSIVNSSHGHVLVHPTLLAIRLEMPSIEASRRQIDQWDLERCKETLPGIIGDKLSRRININPMTAVDFQRDCIDILPDDWTIVSLTMNEEATELWAALYNRGELPFVLRLPMSRSRDDGLDEVADFTYKETKTELVDIIRCSDETCHATPDSSDKNWTKKWWEERQTQDDRLKALLINIEDIWFGGFKGLFSLHDRQPNMMARFRKTLDGILDRHLPSRQNVKVKKDRLFLDHHVLELFIGLNIDDEDLDEHVMDLLFFIVDILSWNNEANACDEIDFDVMAIETIDAMKAYHNETSTMKFCSKKHLILRLEKRLHCFPWESMPCLQGVSISRVGSLLQIRERLLYLESQRALSSKVDSIRPTTCRVSKNKGTYILNPSSDLLRTESFLNPYLSPLNKAPFEWTAHVRVKPTEDSFTTALTKSDLFLYVGHGSGSQYCRPRAVRRLESCASVVWLMGCSSGKVEEYGDFEAASVPLGYLAAGRYRNIAPPKVDMSSDEKTDGEDVITSGLQGRAREGLCMSVVATLWDVTDKDIDKFTVTVGTKWGLFDAQIADVNGSSKSQKSADLAVLKTPSRSKASGSGIIVKTPRAGSKDVKTPGRTKVVSKANDMRDRDPFCSTLSEGSNKINSQRIERNLTLAESVAQSRDVTFMRYLNGAAVVVYGLPHVELCI